MRKHQLIKKINSIIILLLLGLCLLGCKDNVPLQISAIGNVSDTTSLTVNLKKAGTLKLVLKRKNIVIDTLTLKGNINYLDMFYLSELDIVLHLNLKDAFYEQYDSCHEESINFEGLSRCSKLETILLPSNIKSVSFNAFVDCINLKEVQIVDSLKYTGQDAVELFKNEFTNQFYNEFRHINFKYKQPVNGYTIKGTLVITDYCPKLYYKKDESSVMGSVVLELSKDGERFHITHYPFYLNSSAFYGYNEFINGSLFYLNYNPDRCSFYFEDLDFDGEEELIFSHYHEGQRFNSRLVAYSLENRNGTAKQFYQRTDSPFDQIDAFTTFNKNKEEIVLFFSSGSTNWEKRIYKKSFRNKYYIESPNKFDLIEIIELNGDTISYYTNKREFIKKERFLEE